MERCYDSTEPRRGPAEVESDAQLMANVAAGSVGSFAELYDRYCDRAYRVAVVACRDKDRAQDAVQDGFLSIWNAERAIEPSRARSQPGY
jgi:DNA-directed RNA polymerase specialized sigma24 family protein